MEKIKFINDIIKPWEVLNRQLNVPFAVNTSISDFTTSAGNLAIAIKHLPENLKKLKPKDLSNESEAYRIISDLADSVKHGKLSDGARNCILYAGSMFERNKDGLVRFLRITLNVKHNTLGDHDFMEISRVAALFIASKIDFRSDWNPIVMNNDGLFSNQIHVHASSRNQIEFREMIMQYVESTPEGRYKKVDLNSTIVFTLTVDQNLSTPQ